MDAEVKAIFFQYGNRKFHVNLMNFPERVYGSHPKQEGRSFEEYLNTFSLYNGCIQDGSQINIQ